MKPLLTFILILFFHSQFAQHTQIKETDLEKEAISIAELEKVPVFLGCVGNNEDLNTCFDISMRNHFATNFNIGLTEKLNLPKGITKLYIAFIIDKNGDVTEINVRAPHEVLEKEAERVAKLLPKFIPGEQNGMPVSTNYMLPLNINTEIDNTVREQ